VVTRLSTELICWREREAVDRALSRPPGTGAWEGDWMDCSISIPDSSPVSVASWGIDGHSAVVRVTTQVHGKKAVMTAARYGTQGKRCSNVGSNQGQTQQQGVKTSLTMVHRMHCIPVILEVASRL
jgi:hypothetical protein